MQFIIDADTLQLMRAINDRSPLTLYEGKRGDHLPFEVMFVRAGIQESLAVGSTLTFACKTFGKYDSEAVVFENDFTLEGSGTTAKYTATPSFNTEELDALFLIDENETNDPVFVDLMAEFTWQVGAGPPTTSKTFIFRVHNDVVRASETPPAPAYTWLKTGTEVPKMNQLRTAFAGANNDIVWIHSEFTQMVITAVPSATVRPIITNFDNGIATVNIGSAGGGTANTMTANSLLSYLNDAPYPLGSPYIKSAVLADGNNGTGQVVPGTYDFSPTPTIEHIGETYICATPDWQFTEWVALDLRNWVPRTAGIILRADGDWYRQTLAADGTAQYDLLPNQ